jgi:hypothetical protein
MREFVDQHTEHPGIDAGLPGDDATLGDAREAWTGATATAQARGTRLESEIEALLAG